MVNINSPDIKTVYPDIIIHHRGKDENLLVIEMKKSSNPKDDTYDNEKLNAYKLQLHYQHAIFLRVVTGYNERKITSCIEELVFK